MTTLARQVRRQHATTSMRGRIGELESTVKRQETMLIIARTHRVAAQRGLIWYVRRLQRLHEWLIAQPEGVQALIAPTLKELGLYDIKVGYDPETDLEVQAAIEAGQLPPLDPPDKALS